MGRNRGERFVRSNRPVREIVDSPDGERSPSRPTADQDVLIQEQARAAAPDGCGNRIRVEPVVVIAEDGKCTIGGMESCHDLVEPSEIAASVTDEVTAEDNEIGRQFVDALRHAGEPSRRDGWTVVQVGDQRDAVAGELRREVGYREGDLRRDEPRVLPAKKRRGETLRQPTEGYLGESLEDGSPSLSCWRVGSRMQEGPLHRHAPGPNAPRGSDEHASDVELVRMRRRRRYDVEQRLSHQVVPRYPERAAAGPRWLDRDR